MKPKFTDWLAERLGTHKWAVCRASAKRREKYDVFLSQKRYSELRAEWESLVVDSRDLLPELQFAP
jgi:hypothetical protein